MAKNEGARTFGGFQLPGFQMPDPLAGSTLADNPVVNTLIGSMDFMKNFWGGTAGGSLGKIAGFIAPTLDIEELDRKITDLKAVEGWLQTNASMLRATVQALEVQRNTIATLKSFGDFAARQGGVFAASEPTSPPQSSDGEAASEAPLTPVPPRTTAGLPPGWPKSASESASKPERSAAPHAPRAAQTPSRSGGAQSDAKEPAASAAAANAAAASQAAQASLDNAAAWWKLLQDQFVKVAGAAVASAPAGAAAKNSGAKRTGSKKGAGPKDANGADVTARSAKVAAQGKGKAARMPAPAGTGAKAASKPPAVSRPARKTRART